MGKRVPPTWKPKVNREGGVPSFLHFAMASELFATRGGGGPPPDDDNNKDNDGTVTQIYINLFASPFQWRVRVKNVKFT